MNRFPYGDVMPTLPSYLTILITWLGEGKDKLAKGENGEFSGKSTSRSPLT